MSSSDDAKKLIDDLRNAKETFKIVHEQFYKQYTIDDKTLEEWQEEFYVKIPKDANIDQCREIASQLADLHHKATFYLNRSSAEDTAFVSAKDKEYRKEYSAQVTRRQANKEKLPAASTLKTITEERVQQYDDVILSAQLVKEFWKKNLEHLKYVSKLLNDMVIINGYEIKVLGFTKQN